MIGSDKSFPLNSELISRTKTQYSRVRHLIFITE